MLVGSCIWGTICKYENGMPKVARKAFNIGEVWEPVCCHGNKTGKLKLWSIISWILLQRIKHFWYKLTGIFFSLYMIKFGWVCDVITWLICIFWKLEYLWNKKRYLKIVYNIFLLMQATCLCFKMASIEKMQFLSQWHLKLIQTFF